MGLEGLPMVIAPHPVNDLQPDPLAELARAAYPIIIKQLTSQGEFDACAKVDFVHPGKRNTWGADAPVSKSAR